MKYYIDFDHTLYNTNCLISDMIDAISKYLLEKGDFEKYPKNFKNLFPDIELINIEKNLNTVTNVLRSNFGRPKDTVLKIPYNIFSLIKYFTKLFDCNYIEIESILNKIIDNGKKYLYEDSIAFLYSLKKAKYEVYILSHDGNDLEFQVQKIKGSGILEENLLDAAIITKESKADLTNELLYDITKTSIINLNSSLKQIDFIDYANGIFIDDRPKDLERLYKTMYKNETSPFKPRLYRMVRKNGTYSKLPINILDTSGIIQISDLKIENFLNAF